MVLRWHGTPPAELLDLVEARSGAGFRVRLYPTASPGGELSAEAGHLVRQHPGTVTSAWPRTEGGGIGLGLDPSVAGAADAAALARLGITSRFPLFPESRSAPVPAGG